LPADANVLQDDMVSRARISPYPHFFWHTRQYMTSRNGIVQTQKDGGVQTIEAKAAKEEQLPQVSVEEEEEEG